MEIMIRVKGSQLGFVMSFTCRRWEWHKDDETETGDNDDMLWFIDTLL